METQNRKVARQMVKHAPLAGVSPTRKKVREALEKHLADIIQEQRANYGLLDNYAFATGYLSSWLEGILSGQDSIKDSRERLKL